MRRSKIIGIVLMLTLVAAACSSGDDEEPAATGTTGGDHGRDREHRSAVAVRGEHRRRPGVDREGPRPRGAVGRGELEHHPGFGRAGEPGPRSSHDRQGDGVLEQAQECDTGTGGDVVMGYADGGGDTVNVWRAVSHMEAILQALSYPEIGTIVSTAADFNPDPAVPANDIRFLIQRGVDFIVGYPDAGVAIADAIKEADDAGIPYVSFSAGWVGLPDQEGALVPGEDYLTVVGEDLCALGKSFAQVLNDGVGTGEVAILGGTPGNALSLGWQRCTISSLASGVDLVNPPANENSTTGDTSWYPPAIPGSIKGC